ncbi:hypothetical protein Tco_0318001 [Tanacetum coccineum]
MLVTTSFKRTILHVYPKDRFSLIGVNDRRLSESVKSESPIYVIALRRLGKLCETLSISDCFVPLPFGYLRLVHSQLLLQQLKSASVLSPHSNLTFLFEYGLSHWFDESLKTLQ